MTLALGIVLAAVVVLVVALPFLREPAVDDDRLDRPGEHEVRRLGLAEERDRALAALRELEFDHRAGTVGDTEYRELLGPLRRAVAVALRAVEEDRRYGPEMSESFETESFESPDLPSEPVPPPDEGTPPTPAPVPEPYPPPDEATLPQE
jgi:hypothetical protein